MLCEYCQLPITDQDYLYKFFKDQGIHKPVHGYHFKTGLKEVKNGKV